MHSKYADFDAFYREAEQLRKDAHDKWKQVIGGKLSTPGISQDYLIAKTRALLDIAFAIEGYSMSVQPMKIDPEQVEFSRQLAALVRKALP